MRGVRPLRRVVQPVAGLLAADVGQVDQLLVIKFFAMCILLEAGTEQLLVSSFTMFIMLTTTGDQEQDRHHSIVDGKLLSTFILTDDFVAVLAVVIVTKLVEALHLAHRVLLLEQFNETFLRILRVI